MALHKRAMSKTLAEVLIGVAIVIIVLGFVLRGTVFATEKASVATCAKSVFVIDTAAEARFDLEAHLNCPTVFYGELKAKGNTQAEKEQFVMREIANQMITAWKTFGEGTMNTFQRKGPFADKSHCMVWAEFWLPSGIQVLTHDKFTNFMEHKDEQGMSAFDYMKDGLPPGDFGKKSFFIQKGIKKEDAFELSESFNELEAGTPYSIIFYAVPGNAITFAGFQLYQYDEQSSAIFITTTEDIANLGCEVLQG
ncbi:hypothetical protein KY339_02805 [Candidatus Woesearchaeota archaeon]|nr:hypothetical protein [Candidatus Woesearchaeota archaeon]